MSDYLPEEIVETYKSTSNPECCHPYYDGWGLLSNEERFELVRKECSAINKIPLIKNKGIIATPYLNDCRHHKFGTWAEKICVNIYFHGDPDIPFDIDTVCGIGFLPVCYGICKDKKKVDEWKNQIKKFFEHPE